jgi:ABC-type phosphate transport system substrate-binding protein
MKTKLTLAIILFLTSSLTWGDLVVIVNVNNSINTLERKQVIDLFMGRTSVFPNDKLARPFDINDIKNVRANFYRALTGKNEAQVDAYWATLMFAGRMSPPEKMKDEVSVIATVVKNEAAIGYVNRQALPEGVKIVMELQLANE